MSALFRIYARVRPRFRGLPPSDWNRTRHEWLDTTGKLWVLSEPSTGVFLRRAGVRGLGMPAHDDFSRTSPALAGQQYQGTRVLPREVFWPLYLYSDTGSTDWLDLDRDFWRGMHRAKAGAWRVTTAHGTRELSCRFGEAEDTYDTDPARSGWANYGVRLIADDPFWYGEWVHRTFVSEAGGASFFGDGAPAFTIGSANTLARSMIDNPGDERSYLVYILNGPFDSASVGIGDGGVATQYQAPVPAGQSVVIDTRPDSRATARLIDTPTAEPGTNAWVREVWGTPGVNVFANTGAIALNSPLQAGENRTLSLSMSGNGSVTVAHRPPYWRAW